MRPVQYKRRLSTELLEARVMLTANGPLADGSLEEIAAAIDVDVQALGERMWPTLPALSEDQIKDELVQSGLTGEILLRILAGDPNGLPPSNPNTIIDANVSNSLYAGVVSLSVNERFICSGTLISDVHVLTAAHCIDGDTLDAVRDYSLSDINIRFNHTAAGVVYEGIAAATMHPDWNPPPPPLPQNTPNDDIAVIELNNPAPIGVPIYPLRTAPFDTPQRIFLVGYGDSGVGVPNMSSVSGDATTKRSGQNVASSLIPDDEGSGIGEVFLFDFDGPNANSDRLNDGTTLGNNQEVSIAGGDSGGPSFVWTDDGDSLLERDELTLFGVNTFSLIGPSPDLFGEVSGGMVVSSYLDFIDDFVDIGDPELVIINQSGGSTDVTEGGATDTYTIGLASIPAGSVSITATADAETELSLNGITYSSSVTLTLNNTVPDTIFVRAIDDELLEGQHTSVISHHISSTNDPGTYPQSLNLDRVFATVSDEGGAHVYRVNTFLDLPDQTPLGDSQVDVDLQQDGIQVSLRAAIQELNASGGGTIVLPEFAVRLSLAGSGPDLGDLDISESIAIHGAGPGVSLIDASLLGDRIFEVMPSGDLTLTGMTLNGGSTTSIGGAILVGDGTPANQARLTVSETAFQGNTAATGGAVYSHNYSTADIRRSLFTGNHATAQSGALHSNNVVGAVTIEAITFAGNTTGGSGPNIGSTGTIFNLGHNLIDNASGSSNIFSRNKGDHIGSTDVVVTGVRDTGSPADGVISLREAVQAANGSDETVWVPAWEHTLSLSGTDNLAALGDLDVTGTAFIRGAGPGLSVIRAAGLGDRIFEVRPTGDLTLHGLTLTGGDTSSLGGAILVGDGTASNQARLTVDRTAFVNNTAATGGAIYNHNYSTATVEQSVFTDNHATIKSGALHSNNVFGSLTLAYLTLAQNSTGGTGPNIGSTGITHNLGYNLVDDINGAAHIFDSRKGDHVGNADFVVTGISDRLDPTDDTRTLRESIQDANSADGTIWLPAWRSVLTRRGFDDTALSGDLDVLGDISIVGAGAGLSMVDAMGSNGLGDRVFEVRPTGSLSIRGLTVSGGYTTSLGGAVLVGNGAPQNQAVLTVDRSSFEGNRADVGGAIYNHNYSTADVRRSAFTSNHAVSKSGALHSNNIAGSLTFEALTLAQNTANAEGPNIASTGVTHNLGNNLVDDVQGAAHIFDMAKGDHVGSVDFVVTNLADRDALFDGGLSLREAVRASNAASVGPKLPGIPGFAGLTNDEGVESLLGEGRPSGGGRVDSARTIWLPAWEHRLTLQGFDAFALAGDLDILGDVTLVGTGPGFSVVDAGGADGLNDRVFEVRPQGHLALSRMTVAGGSTTSVGGGVLVGNGGSGNRATFLATETSFVDNVATNGGGIYNHNRSNTDVRRSVFTRNQATSTSGAIHSNNLPGLGQIVFEGLVLAQNTASIGPNVGSNTAAFVNLGNNLVDITTGAGSLFVGDTIGTANYVVNSVADTFDPASGTRARSLREAVDLANDSGSDSSIWLAPWLFRLNRQGTGGASEGAIDVLGSSDLTIQGLDLGASNAQTTLDATDLLDSVFDDIGTGDLFVLDVDLIEP